MNTKQIPILIVLLAAGISCVFSIVQKVSFSIFFRRFLITVLVFTVVGWIVKELLDRAFPPEEEEENPEGEEPGEGQPEGEEGGEPGAMSEGEEFSSGENTEEEEDEL
jgi:flagellar biosynthesis/type III secretory pathway M-ring protein FliF/YscJ